MPHQSGPSAKVLEMIEALGGSVWTSTTPFAAGGAALARAVINAAFPVPDAARMLLGWRGIDCAAAGAVAESGLVVFDIQGQNYNFQPQEIICGNVSGSILATGTPLPGPSEYYDVFAPVKGGELWNVGVEPCDAEAGNRRDAIEFTWTDVRLPLPTIRSQCSREIAIAIAAVGEVVGLAMPITDAHKLIEVGGCATESVNTAAEELNGTLVLRSTGFKVAQEIRCLFEPYSGSQITPSSNIAYVTRRMERQDFKQPSVTITAALDVDLALAAAGQYIHYIRWI
jgi:hypothetical protein